MSRRTCRTLAGILLLLSTLSSGCLKVYRSETDWHADGTVDRAIYQEWEATPELVRRSKAWQQTTSALCPQQLERQKWAGRITKLPVKTDGNAGPYFAAWGCFQSPQAIPAHFLRKAPKGAGVPDSELVRECRWTDYAFVREYRWRETLSDVVKFADMCKAREQLADLLIDLGRDSINNAFGQDYDVTDLVTWLRTEGKTWLAEITDYAYVQAAVQKGPSGFSALADGVAEISARHGLALKARGKFLEGYELDKVLRDFVVEKISLHVHRKKDGGPVEKKTVTVFLEELNNPFSDTSKALQQATDRVVVRKYGGKEKFEEQMEALIVRIVGLHWTIWTTLYGDEFDYSLTVPGEVVNTNGQFLSTNKLRWQFHEGEAYPLGYVMECRSLLPDLEAQKNLLQNQPLADRETMLQFVALIADREPLRQALLECLKRKSMAPLYEYQENVAPAKCEVEDVNHLLKLLMLPSHPNTGK